MGFYSSRVRRAVAEGAAASTTGSTTASAAASTAHEGVPLAGDFSRQDGFSDRSLDGAVMYASMIQHALQMVVEDYRRALDKEGLGTHRQLLVLAALEASDGTSQTELSHVTKIDRSTLSDIVRRLERARLIARRRAEDDARAYVLTLTPQGRDSLTVGRSVIARVEKDLIADGIGPIIDAVEAFIERRRSKL